MAETVGERLAGVWARTDRIFEILAPGAFLAQPIALRHPFIFYLGHLPAFAWNHVCVGVLDRPPSTPRSTSSSPAASIPTSTTPPTVTTHPEVPDRWPTVAEVLAYRDRVRAAVLESVDAVAGAGGGASHGPGWPRLLDGDRARADASGDAALHAPAPPLRPEGPAGLAARASLGPTADRPRSGARGDGDARRAFTRGLRLGQ